MNTVPSHSTAELPVRCRYHWSKTICTNVRGVTSICSLPRQSCALRCSAPLIGKPTLQFRHTVPPSSHLPCALLASADATKGCHFWAKHAYFFFYYYFCVSLNWAPAYFNAHTTPKHFIFPSQRCNQPLTPNHFNICASSKGILQTMSYLNHCLPDWSITDPHSLSALLERSRYL